MTKRLGFIDGVRGLCMMLIILIHLLPIEVYEMGGMFFKWANLFKVALFYMVSGYLFFMKPKREPKKLFNSLLKTMGVPYFIFSLIFMIFNIILATLSSTNNVVSIITRDIIDTLTLRGIGTLWFLPTIFLTIIMANYLFNNQTVFKISICVSLVLFIVFYYINLNIDTSYLVVENLVLVIGKTSFSYFNFTIIYFINQFTTKKNLEKYSLFPLIISVALAFFISDVDLNNYNLGGNWGLFILASLSSSVGIFYFFEQYYDRILGGVKTVLAYIGKNSLSFMVIHFYPIIVINKIIELSTSKGFNVVIGSFLGFIFLLLITMATTEILKKTKLSFLLAK